jgi:hypothetical protein
MGMELICLPTDVLRRIGYMKIYMQDSLSEPEALALPPASLEKLRDRVKTYGEAIDDVLAVLRQWSAQMPHAPARIDAERRKGQP